MSYRCPQQPNRTAFNNQFGVPQLAGIGPVSSSKSASESFEDLVKNVDDVIDNVSKPIKPYVPAIGSAFIVATFYEDSMRIFSQWSEQVHYLHNYRHVWRWLVVVFLFVNIVVMLVASTLLILRKKPEIATLALVAVVILQGLFYGLIFDGQFLLRNLSFVGGLILAFSESLVRAKLSLSMPGLPMLNNKDNKKYF